jgi:hypothetical protein
MFSEIDKTIFTDSCEVISTSQLFVYPIFKNGKSSLYDAMAAQSWSVIRDIDIALIREPITVFVREPRTRFISGVNTYIQHLQRDVANVDVSTALWFVNQYLFLNRHYCPQFYWLINLARWAGRDVMLDLRPMKRLNELTDINNDAGVAPLTPELDLAIQGFDWHQIELYLLLDEIIMAHVGRQITFRQLLQAVYRQHRELYDLIFARTHRIVSLTDALS